MTPMEAAAKAAYEAHHFGNPPMPWDKLYEIYRQEWRDVAYAAVRAYNTELSTISETESGK